MRHSWLLLPIAILLGSCSSEDEELSVKPERLFTGHEASTTFEVPITAYYPQTMQWSIVDKSVATIEILDGGGHVKVTAQKPGKTMLRATANGRTKDIPVTVTEYTIADIELGNDLYQSNKESGGDPDPDATNEKGTVGLGCIDCHGARGTATHDPTKIGGFDDQTVLDVIATGKRPDGSAIPTAHKFSLTPDQQKAILARVRSLQPRGWP